MTIPLRDAILKAAGHPNTGLWLVGGPVRDTLLDLPCDDWDMVCRKAKAVAQATAKTLHAKFITLDDKHRIYRVILPEAFRPVHTLDFAELQGKTIEEDLKRRDFTINAMAVKLMAFSQVSPLKDVIDPFGGERDLKKGVIRLVSERALREDPLRLLRAFRFAAQFQFTIAPLTVRRIRKEAKGLSIVAAERIREELLRLGKQRRTGHVLRAMDRARVLSMIFPEIEACRRTAVRFYGPGGVLKHSFETVENFEWIVERIMEEANKSNPTSKASYLSPAHASVLPLDALRGYLLGSVGGYPRIALLKWAAFLHDIGKPATAKMLKGRLRFFEHEHVGAALAMSVGKRLRCSRQEVQLLGLWVRNHMRTGNLAAAPRITDKAVSRYFRDLGEDGVGMILISLADHYGYLSRQVWGKGKDSVEKISRLLLSSYYEQRAKILPQRLLNGHDLMKALKLKPGPKIGQLLEKIQDAQSEGKVTTKEEALSFAKRKLRAKS